MARRSARSKAGSLGRRSIADKLISLLGRNGGELRRELELELREAIGQALAHPEEFEAEDAEDFGRYSGSVTAATVVSSFFSDAPVGAVRAAAQIVEDADEELGSGGPPISPVHDSLNVAWMVFDVPVGRGGETFASITRALLRKLKIHPEVIAPLRALEDEPLGLYIINDVARPIVGVSNRLHVEELATGRTLWVQCVESFDLRARDFVLLRPTPLAEDRARLRQVSHLAYPTPYVCEEQSKSAWVDYFERAAAELGKRLDATSLAEVMRGTGTPRRWLDFVFEGYVGQREKNVVRVVGVPDLPHTLPHHLDHDPDERLAIPPGAPPNERFTLLARRVPEIADTKVRLAREAAVAIFKRLEQAGGEAEAWAMLVIPTLLYEGTPDGGRALLDDLEREPDVDADMVEFLAAVRGGRSSLFEVLKVRPGEGMWVRDLLSGTEHDVFERAGSTGIPTRIVLFARIVRYRDTWLFDAVFPRPAAAENRDALVEAVTEALGRREPAPIHGAEVFEAAVAWQRHQHERSRKRAAAPMPTLVTTTGEPLEFCKAALAFAPARRTDVLDAIARLRRCVPLEDTESPDLVRFETFTGDGAVEAQITVEHNVLLVEANAEARLDRVIARLRSKLTGLLTSVGRSVLTPQQAAAAAVPRPTTPPTDEMRAVVAGFMRERYEGFLDESIPALDGLTPREASKRKAMRPRLDALLRDHEMGTSAQVGPGVIDFDQMRRVLRLG